jgi:SNF2 family DNA or RNA helicase
VGQDKPVTVYHLVANRTIDEHVLKILAAKKAMSNEILGDGAEADAPVGIEELEKILEDEYD